MWNRYRDCALIHVCWSKSKGNVFVMGDNRKYIKNGGSGKKGISALQSTEMITLRRSRRIGCHAYSQSSLRARRRCNNTQKRGGMERLRVQLRVGVYTTYFALKPSLPNNPGNIRVQALTVQKHLLSPRMTHFVRYFPMLLRCRGCRFELPKSLEGRRNEDQTQNNICIP